MAKRGFRIADAYVEIHVDNAEAKAGVRNLPREVGSDAETSGRTVGKRVSKGLGDEVDKGSTKAGKDGGGKLAQGFQLSFIRNSPLIAAAVAGGLAAGAPLMLGAASLLFGGIGLLAVSQSQAVRQTFAGLWNEVKTGAAQSAASLIPVAVHAMSMFGTTFQQLRPMLQATFSAAGPQILTLTQGIDHLALNSMPGFMHAVQNSNPVMTGFANLLGSTGTGLTQFFDSISQHAPAAGSIFSALGGIVQQVLGILGQLMGQGAELGSIILPGLSTALSLVNSVLHLIAPVLPIVVAGFAGLRLASVAATGVAKLSQSLALASYSGSAFAGTAGRMSTAVSAAGPLIGVLAAATAGLATIYSQSNNTMNGWTDALIRGGEAGRTATETMNRQEHAGLSLNEVWDRAVGLTHDGIAQLQGYSSAQDKVTSQYREQLAAMDPVTRAQTLQTQAFNDLGDAIGTYGLHSTEAIGAAQRYKDASDAVKTAQDQENLAIHGVTQAMVDQADQAMAAIDSQFAAQHAAIQQRDAEAALAAAIKAHGSASNAAKDAQLNYNESIYRAAAAAATATVDQSGLTKGTLEYKDAIAGQLLANLERMSSTLTGPAKAAIDGYIQALKDAGVTTDGLGGKVAALGTKHATPTVTVDPKPAQKALDFIGAGLGVIGATHPVPKVSVDTHTGDAQVTRFGGVLSGLDRQRPTPVAGLNPGNLPGRYNTMLGMLGNLGRQRPNPIATLTAYTGTAQQQVNEFISANRNIVIYTKLVAQKQLSTGGSVGPMTRAASGRIVGPGTGTSDSVPAAGADGSPWRLSAHEFVVNAAVSQAQGSNMDLLNAGRATIVPTGVNPTTGTGTTNGGIRIEHLDVHLHGTFDFSDRTGVRKMVGMIRDELRDLERSYR